MKKSSKSKAPRRDGRTSFGGAKKAVGTKAQGGKVQGKGKIRSDGGRDAGVGVQAIKFPLYGVHAVEAAWLNRSRQIHQLYVTQGALQAFEPVMVEARKSGLTRPEASVVDRTILDKMLPQGAVHQGIAIHCAPLQELGVQDLVIASRDCERCVLVMLDQVTDPHNVGAIVRSACALGAGGMIMQRKHAPELSGVLAKIATGAIEHIPVAQETNLSRALEVLKDEGYFVIGLDEHDENQIGSIGAARHNKIVLVLGSEGDGMRRLVREHCDVIAQLPVPGAIKSLNVSNAAAVALYAVLT